MTDISLFKSRLNIFICSGYKLLSVSVMNFYLLRFALSSPGFVVISL